MKGTCWDKLDFSYKEPAPDFIKKELEKIENVVIKFCQELDIESGRIDTNVHTLKEIILRLDMRRLYFFIYHDKMKANEYKINAGLFIFWILKLRPFWVRIEEEDSDDMIEMATYINEKICIFIVISLLREYNADFFKYGEDLIAAYVHELEYSFRFRDLSKESMFLMFDPFYYLYLYHESVTAEGKAKI